MKYDIDLTKYTQIQYETLSSKNNSWCQIAHEN